jgi:hypothetical protein
MVISTDVVLIKDFIKFSTFFMVKILNNIGRERTYPNIIKAIYENPIVIIMLNKKNIFSSYRNSKDTHFYHFYSLQY